MRVVDARPPRRGQLVAGDLPRPLVGIDVHDDQLLGLGADPDPLADQLVRYRVDRITDARRSLGGRPCGSARSTTCAAPRQPVHVLVLLPEQHHRRLAGRAVRPRVDIGHELLARPLQRPPIRILLAEVVIGRDQIRLRDRDRRLRCRPCSAGPPARTSRSSARNGARPQRSSRCAPRSRTHARPSPSSRYPSTHTSEPRPRAAACGPARSPRSRSSYRATAPPPETATTPATRRTTPPASRPPPARRRSPTATTTPAAGSTAASAAVLLPPAALGLRDRPPRRAIRPLIPHRDQHPVRLIRPDLRA